MKKSYCKKCKWGHDTTIFCLIFNKYTDEFDEESKALLNGHGMCRLFLPKPPNLRTRIINKLFR